MASANKINCFVEDMAEKVHNLGADDLKFALHNVAPVATNTVWANLTEIAAGNGYAAGGVSSAQVSSAQSSGTYKLVLTDKVITASGGSIGPFRYVSLRNNTPAAGPLIEWWDYGSSITLADGETFTIDTDGTNGVLQVA